MSETLDLKNGPENAISVNSERGPTMIWRDGDTVTLVMRMVDADRGVDLGVIETRLQDLRVQAQHEYHLREIFSPVIDEKRTFEPEEKGPQS